LPGLSDGHREIDAVRTDAGQQEFGRGESGDSAHRGAVAGEFDRRSGRDRRRVVRRHERVELSVRRRSGRAFRASRARGSGGACGSRCACGPVCTCCTFRPSWSRASRGAFFAFGSGLSFKSGEARQPGWSRRSRGAGRSSGPRGSTDACRARRTCGSGCSWCSTGAHGSRSARGSGQSFESRHAGSAVESRQSDQACWSGCAFAPRQSSGPAIPVAPSWPVSPVVPVGPAAPGVPLRPVDPVAPLSPVSPLSPAGPDGPVSPPERASRVTLDDRVASGAYVFVHDICEAFYGQRRMGAAVDLLLLGLRTI
jgi:hypothetical protein